MSIGLDELAIAPERAADLSDEDRRVLRYRIEAVRAALDLGIKSAANGVGRPSAALPEGDVTIDLEEAARQLGVSVSYMHHHRSDGVFPRGYFVRQGRRLMVSHAGHQTHLKTLRARGSR